jgi:hypothetical protein
MYGLFQVKREPPQAMEFRILEIPPGRSIGSFGKSIGAISYGLPFGARREAVAAMAAELDPQGGFGPATEMPTEGLS